MPEDSPFGNEIQDYLKRWLRKDSSVIDGEDRISNDSAESPADDDKPSQFGSKLKAVVIFNMARSGASRIILTTKTINYLIIKRNLKKFFCITIYDLVVKS